MNVARHLILFLLIFCWFLSGWPPLWQNQTIETVHAAVSITAATGGSSISADTNGNDGTGAYTNLTGPVFVEGARGDVGVGTIILNAPSGFAFDTSSNVTITVTNGNCGGGSPTPVKVNGSASQTVTPTATTITHTVTTASSGNAGCSSTLTYTNIRVRPTSGTPLSSGNLTKSGTSTISGITDGSTNLGTLVEVAGAKSKLTIATQPSTTASVNDDFLIKPVVSLQDQYGNTITADNSSTITTSVVLSNQSCGGTAGSGTLTSTPASGSAVSSGVLTYTAMEYSAGESIKICFTSSGVTSALSDAVDVQAAVISVIVTSDGTVSYGILGSGESKSTIQLSDKQTVQNDGDMAADLNIKTSAPSGWSLGDTSSVDTFVHEFSTNGGSNWTTFTTADSYQTLVSNIAASNTQDFDLRLTAPSPSISATQKTITITIQAVQH